MRVSFFILLFPFFIKHASFLFVVRFFLLCRIISNLNLNLNTNILTYLWFNGAFVNVLIHINPTVNKNYNKACSSSKIEYCLVLTLVFYVLVADLWL